jgi:hypothetical protein
LYCSLLSLYRKLLSASYFCVRPVVPVLICPRANSVPHSCPSLNYSLLSIFWF